MIRPAYLLASPPALLMEWFDSLPSLSTIVWVGIPFAYFFGVPLLILATFRTEAFPTLEPVDPEVRLPESVRGTFFTAHEQFLRLGFSNEGTFFLPQAVTNVRTLLVYFVNRSQRVAAMSVVIYGNASGRWTVQASYTELCTAFADDSEICTGNQSTAGAFPIPAHSLHTIHPEIREIKSLLAAHQAMVRGHGGGRRAILNSDEKYQGDVAAYLSSGMTAEFEHARKCGYLRHRGGDQPAFSDAMQASPYRPPSDIRRPEYAATVKGAYLMTWQEIWPLKWIRMSVRLRRDRQLLQQTGFELPTPEAVASRVS